MRAAGSMPAPPERPAKPAAPVFRSAAVEYSGFKGVLLALLAANTATYLYSGSTSEAIDSISS